jgi:hypothetical protein
MPSLLEVRQAMMKTVNAVVERVEPEDRRKGGKGRIRL